LNAPYRESFSSVARKAGLMHGRGWMQFLQTGEKYDGDIAQASQPQPIRMSA